MVTFLLSGVNFDQWVLYLGILRLSKPQQRLILTPFLAVSSCRCHTSLLLLVSAKLCLPRYICT